MEHITREEAYDLLKKYNKDPFHIQHALTVEAVMKWYAEELGFGADAEYWGIVGLLHDIDFELYPEEHCIKAPELLREGGVGEDIIHGVVSHGYGITVDVAPEHEMEKVLFAADELTGLIWAAALMRPSKSTKDMELKSLKKKYKSKGFAAGCSREVIERGAEQLGWELDKLLTMTLEAMKATEDEINAEIEKKKKQRFGRKHPNLYYFAINRTPSVPGPQWLDTTPPALVSNISWKTPRLSRYERTDSTVAASQPECVMNTRSGLAAFKSVSISFT